MEIIFCLAQALNRIAMIPTPPATMSAWSEIENAIRIERGSNKREQERDRVEREREVRIERETD